MLFQLWEEEDGSLKIKGQGQVVQVCLMSEIWARNDDEAMGRVLVVGLKIELGMARTAIRVVEDDAPMFNDITNKSILITPFAYLLVQSAPSLSVESKDLLPREMMAAEVSLSYF